MVLVDRSCLQRLVTAFVLTSVCLCGSMSAQSDDRVDNRPFKLSYGRDLPLLAVSLSFAGLERRLAEDMEPLTVSHIESLVRTDINAFDRSATYRYSELAADAGVVMIISAMAAPVFLYVSPEVRGDALTFGAMYLHTFLLTGAVANTAKALAQRTRPYVFNPDVPLSGRSDLEFDDKTSKDARKSFFSSDAAYGFSMMVFLATTYGAYHPGSKATPYVWGGGLAVASAIGVGRYLAGDHFPTDIIAGTLVGTAIGYLVPALHRRTDAVYVGPGPSGALTASVQLRF